MKTFIYSMLAIIVIFSTNCQTNALLSTQSTMTSPTAESDIESDANSIFTPTDFFSDTDNPENHPSVTNPEFEQETIETFESEHKIHGIDIGNPKTDLTVSGRLKPMDKFDAYSACSNHIEPINLLFIDQTGEETLVTPESNGNFTVILDSTQNYEILMTQGDDICGSIAYENIQVSPLEYPVLIPVDEQPDSETIENEHEFYYPLESNSDISTNSILNNPTTPQSIIFDTD